MANANDFMFFFSSYLGINPSKGCNLGCGYCILDRDNPNPKKVVRNETAKFTLDRILKDQRVSKTNALAFYNVSDPFLKGNIANLLEILEGMEEHEQENIAVLITKSNPDRVDKSLDALTRISRLKKVKPVIMVTYANVPKKVEPTSSSARIELMKRCKELGIPIVQYARPLWEEWTPRDKVREMAEQVANIVDAVVVGGVVVTDGIKKQLKERGVPIPPWNNNKGRYLSSEYRQFFIDTYQRKNPDIAIFTNSSCGISYAVGIPNYMGYYWRFAKRESNGVCTKPCNPEQRERCATAKPSINAYNNDTQKKDIETEIKKVKAWLKYFKADRSMFRIKEGYVNIFARLDRQESRMMRQHTGMYIYFDGSMHRLREKAHIL
ncbi:MAG: radical SAM protein [Candidatus Woesearchaeota archaeon]